MKKNKKKCSQKKKKSVYLGKRKNPNKRKEKMKIKTEAIIYKAKEVVSKKTGAIYKIVGLIIDGTPKDFFTTKKEISDSEVVRAFEENENPFKVQAEINVNFSGARTYVDLDELDFKGEEE